LRRTRRFVALILVGLIAVVAVLAATPVGLRLGAAYGRRLLESEFGLLLSYDSLDGNLFSGLKVVGARLTVPDGPSIATADTLQIGYSPVTLALHRHVEAGVTVRGATAVIERCEGRLLGWDAFASSGGEPPDTASAGGLRFDVDLSVRDLSVVYRDTAAGIEAVASGLAAEGRVWDDSLAFDIACSLSARAPVASGPVSGSILTSVRSSGGRLEVIDLTVLADGLAAEASGVLDASGERTSPSLEASVRATADLAALGPLLQAADGAPALAGTVVINAEAQGALDSIEYAVRLASPLVTVDAAEVREVDVSITGTPRRLGLETFTARTLGGSIAAAGRLDLPEPPASLRYWGDLDIEGLSLAELSGLVLRAGAGSAGTGGTHGDGEQSDSDAAVAPDLGGTLSLSASFDGGVAPESVSAEFSSHVDALTVETGELGPVELAGAIENGTLNVNAECCSTHISAEATLDERGVSTARARVELQSLRAATAPWGLDGLEGRGVVSLDVDRADSALVVRAGAELPSLSYLGIEAGPLDASARGSGDVWSGWFGAFGGALMGSVRLEGGRYRAALAADRLDLAAVVPDSVRRAVDLEGAVSARFTAEGDTAGLTVARGTVSGLSASVRGEVATLDRPFRFTATSDSVVVTRADLTTSFGKVSVSGGIGDRTGRISSEFTDIDMAVVERALMERDTGHLKGLLNGTLELGGGLDSPRFAADLSMSDVSYSGIGFEEIDVEAENDSTDVVFYVGARSGASGDLSVSGTLPVRQDSLLLLRVDRGREFGLSLLAVDLALDVERWGVRGLGGLRRVELDGSALVTGRLDSLSAARGRGSFGHLSADLGLVGLSLRDTLGFDLAGGVVEFDDTTIDVRRRRVLDDERGGFVRFSGAVKADRTLDVSVSVDSLSVGHMVRALADLPSSPVTGRLDVEARVGGTLTAPVVRADWDLKRPAFSGFGFDSLNGRLSLEGRELELERAELRADRSVITASGRIELPGDGNSASGSVEVDIDADDFRLDSIRVESQGIDSISGTLDADLALTGSPVAPDVAGRVSLARGGLKGFDLDAPIEDVEVELTAGGGVVRIDRATVPLGNGSVDATGFVGLDPDGPPTFMLRVSLNDPEVEVRKLLDARLSGNLRWAGTAERSMLEGAVDIDRLNVVYEVSFAELLMRRRSGIVVVLPEEGRPIVQLDVDVELEEPATVESNVADLALRGGFRLRGTTDEPSISGSIYAEEGGTLQYLDHAFSVETLTLAYIDPRRAYPYVDLLGTTRAEDRAGQEYEVTLRLNGFADEAVPVLTSEPALSEPDIVALLTFGDTVGALVSGPQKAGSSGDSFQSLAQRTFISNAFGIAEASLERWLNLDTVRVDDEAITAGNLEEADITIGKQIGDRLSVNYTTQVGRFSDQAVEILFELTRRLSIGTRADPEGNHAINLRLRVPFK